MNADLEKIAAQFTFSKGTTGGKVVGGKLPTPTKVSGGSGSGGTTPPAKTTTPPTNSGSGTGAPVATPAGGTGGGATPPQQQTPPSQQQQKQEKQPNPTVEAAKKDAKQVAGKATDWANKNLGGTGDAVANSNLGRQFLNSKTGQNFQKSKVGKWAMNNKGAAVGLAGAGLAAGGLAIGAAIKRHKEKKKMKEQAQMNAQAMGKSAMEEFTMYENIGAQLEKIAGLEDLTGFSKKDSTTLKNLKAIKKEERTPGVSKRIREIQAKRAGTVGAGAAAAGAAIGGAIALKKHLKKKKAEQKKEALDAAVAHLMEKEAGDGCKCKGKKGKLGNLMTDSTKSDQSADVTGRGGESLLRQKKALDEAVARLLEKA